MKKLLLPLLLVLLISMLAAVESDPSEVVGYVKYDCVPGLNFVAMPMDDGLMLTSEVGAVYNVADEYIDTINMWNSDTQAWDFAVNYGGGFWDPDLEVGTGYVLYFNTSAAFPFYSMGNMPAQEATYNIVAGLNTVMIPLNQSALTLTSEVGATIGDGEYVDTINLWNSDTQAWDFAVNYGGGFWDPDLDVAIGMPLYLNSADVATWPSRSASSPTLRSSRK